MTPAASERHLSADGAISRRPDSICAVERTRLRLYPEAAAGGYTSVDGAIQFYSRVNALIEPHFTLLDIGAGRGAAARDDKVRYRRELRNLKGKAQRVIGIDVDPEVLSNPSLDEARLITGGTFPIETASVDLALSDYVFEHIEEPAPFAAEIARVVKPGGWLCARTPNRYGYISVAARLIPQRFHGAVLSKMQPARRDVDVFPAYYRMNTRRELGGYFPAEQWSNAFLMWNGEPVYFGSSPTLWRMAQALFWMTPAGMRAAIMQFSRRR